MGHFTVEGNRFLVNGEEIRILSGTIHYFRVPRPYWRDRLLKLKNCGFNTVETYVAWNAHQMQPDRYDFSDMLDVEAFIQLAGELGLYVIVRPGPYICAEWDFGGLPWWLLADDNIRLRCMDTLYLSHVDKWFDVLIPKLAAHTIQKGGPVIAMQVENEYGSYGNDAVYLEYIRQGLLRRGVDCLLFTSDGPTDWMLQGGTLPEVFKTANFGSRPEGDFAKLREYQPDGPLVCMEFWNGWFDHWGDVHHTRPAEDVADCFDRMMKMGASVNFYMFHGGANYGYMAGANYAGGIQPTVSNYDYDAPVSESGALTPKYWAVRDVVKKYQPVVDVDLAPQVPVKNYGVVELTEHAPLFANLDNLTTPIQSTCPLPMEKLGQGYGTILYRTRISGPREEMTLVLQDVHDRAVIYLDGVYQGEIFREQLLQSQVKISVPAGGATLDVLVHADGRINYGPWMKDHKGITEGILYGQQYLFHYDIYTLPMFDRSKVNYVPGGVCDGPALYRGTFQADEVGDTFLAAPVLRKGEVWVNGRHIGRMDAVGPQRTLYLPGCWLHKGENVVEIFDLYGSQEPRRVELLDHAVYDLPEEE